MARSEKKKRVDKPRASSDVKVHVEPTDLQCIAILVVLVAIFFYRILSGQSYFWEDFIYQNYPFRSFAATSLAIGQMPLWNPYTFNGMPFLADIQTTVLYIPCLLLTLFVHNGSLNFYWLELLIILHFVLAGVGMFYLAQSFNIKKIPALFAGAAYMLSGYMIVHTIHQQNVTLVAWYPLIFLFFRKALSEQRWLYVFVCGLVLGHSILAGYPQLSLYLYFFLFLYFLFELLTTYRRKKILSRPALTIMAKAASIIAISVALAMIQLLPTFELSDLSQRAQITFQKASEGSLAWSQLATFFLPKMFGTAGAGGFEYFGPGQYFYYWETCVYLGILPLLLTVLSIFLFKKNKYVAFFLGVAIFSLLFALGDNFFVSKMFYDFVPGFSKFRIPARMGIILTFSTSLLSASSLQYFMYEEKTRRERLMMRNVLIAVAGIGILLYGVALSGGFSTSIVNASFEQVKELVAKGIHPSFFILLLSTAALYHLIVKGSSIRLAGIGVVVLFFVDMFVFGGDQNNGTVNPSEYFKRRSDLVQFFKKDGEKELFRVNTRNPQGILPGWDRNQGMVDRIFMLEGYTPLALQRAYAPLATPDRMYDLLNVKYKTVTDPQTGNLSLVKHPTGLARVFFLYNVRVAKTEEELLHLIQSPEFDYRTTAVIEKEPGSHFSVPATQPAWDARITNYTNNEILVDAKTSHAGLLVLSEIFYPGWNAYVDGVEVEIYRTDFNLRGIFISAGEHTVAVKFEPSTFRNGMWISLSTLMVCCIGIVLSVRKEGGLRVRRPGSEEP